MAADKPHPKTTYYTGFPRNPRPQCMLAAVFWVLAHDHRPLTRNEKRNVIYPAKAAGLVSDAPKDSLGVRLAKNGKQSRSEFILTEEGEAYWNDFVKPILPKGFKADHQIPKTRRRSTPEVSLAEIKGS